MAILEDYITGTVSITQGSRNLVGTGTAWDLEDFRSGDLFLKNGLAGVIDVVVDDTHITLVDPWIGADLSAASYRMRYMGDADRTAGWIRNLVNLLGNGTLQSLASLSGSNGKVPMFAGPGTLTLLDRSDLVQGADYDIIVDTLADRAAYDAQPGPTSDARGFAVLVADVGDGRGAIYAKNSNTSGDWSDPVYITAKTVIDILVDDPGSPAAAEVVLTANIMREITFPADLAGSKATVASYPSGLVTYLFKKNGTTFATLTISSSGITTFDGAETVFTSGNQLTVVAPTPRDPTLGGVSMTLTASR